MPLQLAVPPSCPHLRPCCSHTARFNGAWYQAVIVQRLAGGSSARVHFRGWGSEFSEVELRTRLRLNVPLGHAAACPCAAAWRSCRHHDLIWRLQVMNSEDLAKRTRARAQDTLLAPVGPNVVEVSAARCVAAVSLLLLLLSMMVMMMTM